VSTRHFSLKAFRPADMPQRLRHLKITGTITRQSNILSVTYVILGLPAEIMIPVSADMPARKYALWEQTCFEFFLAPKDSDRYWEFNLSPAGHWNVFSFESYRRDMKEEPAFKSLTPDIRKREDYFRLCLKLDLSRITPPDRTLEVAVSAVIKTVNNETTYWALTHTGLHADFHRRDSFTIELAP
jgi:hypothetical protein